MVIKPSRPPGRDLLAWLHERRLLIGDGAMGTALLSAGLPAGACPEIWNLDHAERVEEVLRSYVEAGAELLETNSFGANPARLAAHGVEHRCEEINRAAAVIARRVAGDRALVLGSIGPTGVRLHPSGALPLEEAFAGFTRQAEALASGGSDALIVETMIDLNEAVLAVKAAAATRLPVIACLTVLGDSPARAAKDLESAGACVIGANCGTGPATMIGMVRALRDATTLPIVAQPSAGIPVMRNGRLEYPEAPEMTASRASDLIDAGATIFGGCCGTTPEHVRAFATVVMEKRRRLGRDERIRTSDP